MVTISEILSLIRTHRQTISSRLLMPIKNIYIYFIRRLLAVTFFYSLLLSSFTYELFSFSFSLSLARFCYISVPFIIFHIEIQVFLDTHSRASCTELGHISNGLEENLQIASLFIKTNLLYNLTKNVYIFIMCVAFQREKFLVESSLNKQKVVCGRCLLGVWLVDSH